MKFLFLTTLILGLISCDNSRVPSSMEQTQIVNTQFFIGFDMHDKLKQCQDKFEVLSCHPEFKDSDAFALNCEREGKFAIQCGCNDWICVEDINLELEQNIEDQLLLTGP